jgi:hypothetical protein
MYSTRILFLLSAFLILNLHLNAQSARDLVEETVTKEGVRGKIEFLASDQLKGRDTPSPEQDIAAKYLAMRLQEWGVKTAPGMDAYLQEVRLKKSYGPSNAVFQAGDSTFALDERLIVRNGENVDLEAKVVFLDYGSPEDFQKVNVEGKIVVTRLGLKGEPNVRKAFAASREKRERAGDYGALALVELYGSKQISWKLILRYLGGVSVELDEGEVAETNFPHTLIDDSSNTLAEYFDKLKGKAKLEIDGSRTDRFVAYNVVGMVEGTHPEKKDEIVVYSAHYDHVGINRPDVKGDSIYNGTRDNAIGTVTVLEAAKNIAKHPVDRTALFAFFTAEEKGLLGSEWFVNHPILPLNEIVMCFNSDNAGYNDTSLATIIGLERTTAMDELVAACSEYGLEAIKDPVPDQNLFDRSDQVNFARAGIPAIMYSMGLSAFDDEILKYYHQPADNPDSVDYDYLYRFTKAYVHGCRLVANMEDRPYWTEGDKYFDAGEELYKTP